MVHRSRGRVRAQGARQSPGRGTGVDVPSAVKRSGCPAGVPDGVFGARRQRPGGRRRLRMSWSPAGFGACGPPWRWCGGVGMPSGGRPADIWRRLLLLPADGRRRLGLVCLRGAGRAWAAGLWRFRRMSGARYVGAVASRPPRFPGRPAAPPSGRDRWRMNVPATTELGEPLQQERIALESSPTPVMLARRGVRRALRGQADETKVREAELVADELAPSRSGPNSPGTGPSSPNRPPIRRTCLVRTP